MLKFSTLSQKCQTAGSDQQGCRLLSDYSWSWWGKTCKREVVTMA